MAPEGFTLVTARWDWRPARSVQQTSIFPKEFGGYQRAGARTLGPLSILGETPDLNDGTLVRTLSPLPGPVGVSAAPGRDLFKGSAVAQTRQERTPTI